MTGSVPVNPELLRWARESLQMSVEEVAQRMKKSVDEIEAWENGETFPTYVQLEKLAYGIYKRPIALFFFPEPPDEESLEQTFRTLPGSELDRIPPRIRFLLRKARVLQLNLMELFDGVNPSERSILRDLDFSPSVDAANMAGQVRDYLGIGLAEQQKWGSTDEALKRWRSSLEESGMFVFKDTFNPPGRRKTETGDSPFSGFCLYDHDFPVIYVNNNKPKTRQIFTLFHETAHLLMHTGGVDTRLDDYIRSLTGDNRRIEVLCNRFAAEFLVPSRDFQLRSAGQPVDDRAVSDWANLYRVSRETILRRLLDQGRVSRRYYEEKAHQWYLERDEGGESGGDYYRSKGAYLGERYVEAVFSRYHQGRISIEQAADYLGERTRNVPGMEEWLFRQGPGA